MAARAPRRPRDGTRRARPLEPPPRGHESEDKGGPRNRGKNGTRRAPEGPPGQLRRGHPGAAHRGMARRNGAPFVVYGVMPSVLEGGPVGPPPLPFGCRNSRRRPGRRKRRPRRAVKEMWREPPRVRPARERGLSRIPRTGGGCHPASEPRSGATPASQGFHARPGDMPSDVRALVFGLWPLRGFHARAAAAARRQSPGPRPQSRRSAMT